MQPVARYSYVAVRTTVYKVGSSQFDTRSPFGNESKYVCMLGLKGTAVTTGQHHLLGHSNSLNIYFYCLFRGSGSSVGIATELRAGRSGIESRWGRDFPPVQTGPGALLASCKMGTVSFLGVKYGRGVLLTTHPLLVPWSWKSRAIPIPTLWATPGL